MGRKAFSSNQVIPPKIVLSEERHAKVQTAVNLGQRTIVLAKRVVAPKKLTLGKTNCLGSAMEW